MAPGQPPFCLWFFLKVVSHWENTRTLISASVVAISKQNAVFIILCHQPQSCLDMTTMIWWNWFIGYVDCVNTIITRLNTSANHSFFFFFLIVWPILAVRVLKKNIFAWAPSPDMSAHMPAKTVTCYQSNRWRNRRKQPLALTKLKHYFVVLLNEKNGVWMVTSQSEKVSRLYPLILNSSNRSNIKGTQIDLHSAQRRSI